ncbi:chromosome segregation ATPase [Leptolyngbya sp. FACHB-8]|uniref:chromosome segregation ATPase n=1 Tax=unclassified Leptolyngbya TaxID=2650499 RepID=UPI0016848D10|nr:chromosome segregation ATPase [Leptolyngbya sp. FACHB-8]MBD1911794.1 chromosome segregation ATPase [Leptolyngbya sp. FACHB-8]
MTRDPRLPQRRRRPDATQSDQSASSKRQTPVQPWRAPAPPPLPRPRVIAPAPVPAVPPPVEPPVSRVVVGEKGPRRPAPPPPPPRRTPPVAPVAKEVALPAPLRSSRAVSWLASWQFWVIASTLSISAVGGLAAAILFKIPALPNCPSIFWPTASASLRMYCAQLAANKQTVDDLLEAITLVNSLPPDHPMRAEVNRSIEEWASDILGLAEEQFHRGDLDGAIATANRIPAGNAAQGEVAERIQKWRTIWAQAEKIFKDAENALLEQDPRLAFELAVKLLDVDNRYWQTTKYEELGDLITTFREDGQRLAKIRRMARRGGLENLLKAIEMAKEIKSSSPAYPMAQRVIADLGKDMLELAENALGRRDFDEAMRIVGQIPDIPTLKPEIQDFSTLAQAQAQSWAGGVEDLEAAITQAQRIRRDRPLYERAQALISRWQAESRDVAQLNQARQLADLGTVLDLQAAIAAARQVPRGNPKGEEARDLIRDWTSRIETTEDQPVLQQADALAAVGDLSGAISIAQQIGRGRALHGQAQERIQTWTAQVQRSQDQPLLDRARQLAASGDLSQAVAVANQIGRGRVLYDDAQQDVRNWRAQLNAQASLQEAYRLAASGTPDAYLSAIRAASQIPASTSTRAEADRMIGIWSQGVLQSAQALAGYNLEGAIALLERLPSGTPVSSAAQQQLETWRQMQVPQDSLDLEPAPPDPSPTARTNQSSKE